VRNITGQALAVLALPFTGACSADEYARRAELSAERILARRHADVLGDREAKAQQPALKVLTPEAQPPTGPAAEPRVLDLRTALAIAFRSNRELVSQRESLELGALSLSGSRHDFSPQLALTLGYAFNDPADGSHANASSAAFSASQILPTGGILTLGASSSKDETEDASPEYGALLSVALVQPLLRGGGYALSHEPLIQAERSLVYALRSFELFRESFTIDVARRFYGLVDQKQGIENQRRNLENNEFARRQAEALFAVGRRDELNVLRARRSELTARNDLLEAEETLRLALDRFRIFLGLSEDQPVDVQPDPPPFTPVVFDVDSAVQVALANRLDLLNRREQLEDVERGLLIARDALRPDLNLRLGTSYGTSNAFESPFGGDLERADASLAIDLAVPIDRLNQRNSYRSAQIGLERARRDLEEFEDNLRVDVQSSFRGLVRREQSLEIQRQLIEDQTKNLRIAELRFERGEIENRDVVEASQSLLSAQNSLINEQVNYEIDRLELLRALGILFIDEKGMWK
jgi:outer membrane protein TolC